MDELALTAKLKSLEASWILLDAWLKFWIFLVVLGVVIELVVILIEYFHELHEFRRGVIRPPDEPSGGLLVLGLLGAGLVAVGVAGEFAIHITAGKIESDMRNDTLMLVSMTDAKAEVARERADQLEIALEVERKHLARHVTEQQVHCIAKSLSGQFGQSLKIMAFRELEDEKFAREIQVKFQDALGRGNVDYGFLPEDLRKQSGISIGNGGTKEFDAAVASAVSCLVPHPAKGSPDPNEVLQIIVWPDSARGAE